MADEAQRAKVWAEFGNTGVSSKAIMETMLGNKPSDGWCYPHDNDDLGRCIGLLRSVPEWRARIGEMAAVGPEWAALAARWDELEAAYNDGDRRATCQLVKAIVGPIEDKRPGLVKLRNGTSIYFGSGK